jgi:hypothetical protein
MSALRLVGMLLTLLCFCFGNPVQHMADCPDGKLVLPMESPTKASRLSPDYTEGPWLRLDEEYPFVAVSFLEMIFSSSYASM